MRRGVHGVSGSEVDKETQASTLEDVRQESTIGTTVESEASGSVSPTEPFKNSPWTRVTYDLPRSTTHFEEEESTLRKSPSFPSLANLSTDQMRIHQFLPEKDILIKRSSSLSQLDDLPNELIPASKVEDGVAESVSNTLQKLSPFEKFDDHKLLAGAQSIEPKDAFVKYPANVPIRNIFGHTFPPRNPRPTRPGVNRTALSNPSYVSDQNILTRRGQGSGQDPLHPFSNRDTSRRSRLLRHERSRRPTVGRWFLKCLCYCLPADCLPGETSSVSSQGQQSSLALQETSSVSSHGQQSSLAVRASSQQEMEKLVQNVFGREFQTKCPEFQLMVTFDSVNNRVIFDGTILRYCDRTRFKTAVIKLIKDTGWTQNLKELELDHLIPDKLRGVFSISPSVPPGMTGQNGIGHDTAICILRDKKAHTYKSNRSEDIFSIPYGNVTLKEALKKFREGDVKESSEFYETEQVKAGEISKTNADWIRKLQLIDSTMLHDRLNGAWLRQSEIVTERWQERWGTAPYKAVVYWHRIVAHCSLNIHTTLNNFILKTGRSVDRKTQLQLLRKDVQSVCTFGRGLRNTPDSSESFDWFVEEETTRLLSTYNSAAGQMGERDLIFNTIQGINDTPPITFDFAISRIDTGSFASVQDKNKRAFRVVGTYNLLLEGELPAVVDDGIEMSSESDPGETFDVDDFAQRASDEGDPPSHVQKLAKSSSKPASTRRRNPGKQPIPMSELVNSDTKPPIVDYKPPFGDSGEGSSDQLLLEKSKR